MDKKLQEVIARMKAKQQPSQPSEIKEIDETDEMAGLEEPQVPEKIEKPIVKAKEEQIEPSVKEDARQMSQEEQIAMEIEMLQNNGRFRAELLHQMQEMNRALIVIAEALVNLQDGKK